MDKYQTSKWLKEELEKRGWTQADLSSQSGVSRQVISNYINQKRTKPDPEIILAIAKALKISPITAFIGVGILPPLDEEIAELEDYRELLKQFTVAERREYYEIGLVKIDFKRQAEQRKKQSGEKDE